ncbi:2-oxo acid dehydrogenase subunit E2 [Azospirillum sp. TSA6c]|uniref:2-oxo acid dehydrogenase subunit E2 n=1 Tax=unclassified Azospirillum TaxID=2630922 RepID=UPI000D603E1B|nr:2-oxo acid dehydrogenase subunit E2 [Azospirillum sp. TSA6c]PWC47051.1 branched-chain alpha-keto acid dehydrogenase subunit E2 [Azospirillum sp. TSA6c]PWC53311.1 branched-chain alpha-keto acid dehydrogenase subunit E2 [Azospirillum sp. TSA6c]
MSTIIDVCLPDIGDYKDVPVIELHAKAGDRVTVDSPLITIESDKATMEVPSPATGTVDEVTIELGSRVTQGVLLMRLRVDVAAASGSAGSPQPRVGRLPAGSAAGAPSLAIRASEPPADTASSTAAPTLTAGHATPSVRAMARELGVDLSAVAPTGPKGRILREDVAAHVKRAMAAPAPQAGQSAGLPPWPAIDHARFGPVRREPLSRIQKMSGANLARNALVIPHVTNFDRADVTDAEAFRLDVNAEVREPPLKLTMVAFLIKAAALALRAFPRFNTALDGDELVLKDYVHVGFAVDTPHGLMVPVIRDCDRKGLVEIAAEMRHLADKAREGKLVGSDMQGGCFTISSLGGIGGDGFTPIINAPEVAILGAGRASMQAVWTGQAFHPRLILPISLSWDHRVVDGVAAARFLRHIAQTLSDLRRFAL